MSSAFARISAFPFAGIDTSAKVRNTMPAWFWKRVPFLSEKFSDDAFEICKSTTAAEPMNCLLI